jgi:hypothetical protein
MTLRQYIFFMLTLTVLCWVGWLLVVRFVDPVSGGMIGHALFYGTLGLALWGSLSVVGAVVRSFIRRNEAPARHVASSFRQGLLLTAAVLAALMLQSRGLLSGFNTFLVVLGLAFAELVLISFKSSK